MSGRWRVGRKVGRTIYRQVGAEPSDDDVLIGVMDTVSLAQLACASVNGDRWCWVCQAFVKTDGGGCIECGTVV